MTLRLLSAAFLLPSSLAMAAEPSAPFNGKDLSNWEVKGKAGSKWAVGEAVVSASNAGALETRPGGNAMVNAVASHGQSHDLFSRDKFGDLRLEVEVMVPKGSNSGIYVMGEYEVQIFDSFGVATPGPGDMGAIYSANVPKVNASKAPGKTKPASCTRCPPDTSMVRRPIRRGKSPPLAKAGEMAPSFFS